MTEPITEHFEGEKYTVILDDKGLRALRYGEEWRSFLGDKLIFLMLWEIHTLREERKGFLKLIESEIEMLDKLKESREELKKTMKEIE